MRLVSWNCGGGSKLSYLEGLKPDIAVVQEVSEECVLKEAPRDHIAWVGDQGKNKKGLAIITYGEWKLSLTEINEVEERWFLPRYATNGAKKINLVGAWLNPLKSRDYVSPTLRALEKLNHFLIAGPSIIAGDFNQSVYLDKRMRLATRKQFSDTLKKLEALHLISAWHSFRDEPHGCERQPTYYHRRKEEDWYHIDFVFGSPELQVNFVEIGMYKEYGKVSDHAPLTVEYLFRSANGDISSHSSPAHTPSRPAKLR